MRANLALNDELHQFKKVLVEETGMITIWFSQDHLVC
jgi:hypothetical protein